MPTLDPEKSALRHFYLVLGIVFLVIGIVGVFLPVLPTTPFLLLAAYFFSKSSEKLHAWLMDHKTFGKPLRDWQQHRVIGVRAKVLAVSTILIGMVFLWWRIPDQTPFYFYGKITVIAIMIIVMTFILSQKSQRSS